MKINRSVSQKSLVIVSKSTNSSTSEQMTSTDTGQYDPARKTSPKKRTTFHTKHLTIHTNMKQWVDVEMLL
ncbi:MAG: hypothetical protein KHW87_02035 [Clostridiales bacterium]|nr:hypothetical protein [Clostridiales bacterium]